MGRIHNIIRKREGAEKRPAYFRISFFEIVINSEVF
jgi:hypothetical protein